MSWRRRVIATELRKILAYRADFWVNFLGQTLIQLFIARALWQTIFRARGVDEMGGLTLGEMTLYYLLAPLTLKVLTGENIGFLSREIYDGGLNRYLVWPLNALRFKSLTYMTYALFYLLQLFFLSSLGRLLLGMGPTVADALNLVLGGAVLILAAYLYFLLLSLCELVAFWADNTWSIGVMLRFIASFLGGGYLPLAFFPEFLQSVLAWLPFRSMITLPIMIFMGKAQFFDITEGLGILLLWLPLLSLAQLWLWRRGNLRYTGIGM